MKNSSTNRKLLYEFDSVDTVAMKNASESRKLREHLSELDKQLHSNLVRLETEILSIRLENSEGVPRRRTSRPTNIKDVQSETSSGFDVNGLKSVGKRHKLKDVPQGVRQTTESEMSRKLRNLSGPEASLPKITSTAFLTTKLGSNSFDFQRELNDRDAGKGPLSKSLETISEVGQKHLQAEQRILMSLRRPQSRGQLKPGSRPPTPQAQSPTPLVVIGGGEFRRHSWDSRSESRRLLDPLPDEYLSKTNFFRANSAPNITDIKEVNKLDRRLTHEVATSDVKARDVMIRDAIEAETTNGVQIYVTSDENIEDEWPEVGASNSSNVK